MGLAAVCAGRRWPAREIATRELRSEWSISRPARSPSALRAFGSARRFNVRLGLAAASLISHVIPLCLIQTLNLHCWNCNVFGVSRKMTTINYVRNVGAVVSLLPTGTAARPCRLLWASRGSRVLSFWGALVRVVTNVVNLRCFSCGFLSRCYKRRQSIGFFAENGGFLAWIDDVCNRCPREAIGIALV